MSAVDDLIEEAARALCVQGGFDPDEIMANDGPRWRYYAPGARAVIPLIVERCAKVAESDEFILSDSRKPGSFGKTRADHAKLIASRIRATLTALRSAK